MSTNADLRTLNHTLLGGLSQLIASVDPNAGSCFWLLLADWDLFLFHEVLSWSVFVLPSAGLLEGIRPPVTSKTMPGAVKTSP